MPEHGAEFMFTSESVNEGHPDKLCDQVSDAVLDAVLEQDPDAKVACETCSKTNMVRARAAAAHRRRPAAAPIDAGRPKRFDALLCILLTMA